MNKLNNNQRNWLNHIRDTKFLEEIAAYTEDGYLVIVDTLENPHYSSTQLVVRGAWWGLDNIQDWLNDILRDDEYNVESDKEWLLAVREHYINR